MVLSAEKSPPKQNPIKLPEWLQVVPPETDERELANVVEAYKFIQSLNLNERSNVASIGTGIPHPFFWPSTIPFEIPALDVKMNKNAPLKSRFAWERLLLDTKARLYICEPEARASVIWMHLEHYLEKSGYKKGKLALRYGENAFFQNSGIPADSLDLIVFMDLFGTPELIGNDETSKPIIDKIGQTIKNNGYLVMGDQMPSDAKHTLARIKSLEKKGFKLTEVKKYDKAGIPWIAYQVEKPGR